MDCTSARELVALGYARDVEIASELNVSGTVPVLHHSGAYDEAVVEETAPCRRS